ncbi:hypothetical protein M422DRAFT_35655 [Sphaerobolus stellatus SS14]|uniref:Uncharacterized protein n=1 Tax=Sphaerobolus stellatus (strain SS14) TaxID=990650 RepID=A0A0C9V6F9_SPHS4|nr:hypothetical protein M422DRAFT_35655 [Sphaerobolus stellatus SS14]
MACCLKTAVRSTLLSCPSFASVLKIAPVPRSSGATSLNENEELLQSPIRRVDTCLPPIAVRTVGTPPLSPILPYSATASKKRTLQDLTIVSWYRSKHVQITDS